MRSLFRSRYKITQEFGVNPDYYKKFGLKAHEGLDLIPTGTSWTVYALEDGVVVKDEDNPRSGAYGVNCTIWHSSINKATQYCHLKLNLVDNGMQVKKGQAIGEMGSSGNSTGPHVHLNLFETDDNGARLNKNNGYLGGINPLPFIEEDSAVPQPNSDGNKAVQFDRITSFLHQISIIPTDKSEDYINDDGLLKGVQNLNDENQRKAKRIDELEAEKAEVIKQRDESDKAIITLNTKINDLTAAIGKDAVEDKDNLLHAKELEEQRDAAILELDGISFQLGFQTYDYGTILKRIEEFKKPKDEAIEYQQKLLDEFWKNLIKGRKTKSILDKFWTWIR